MKNDIIYKDAPPDIENALSMAEPITDFLPPPSQLIEKVEKEKVTISLNKRSVDFFKRAAKKEGVPYQAMINNLLDRYVRRYG
ncbi:MAG: BrnA antitoxin family protein [Clostridiales Family XIII bacterium]|jgi:predicted DNA binding CopG/RHH family protein|nr:BrnA antitoxin family protein [Clostridiales Family XIII bacterium]